MIAQSQSSSNTSAETVRHLDDEPGFGVPAAPGSPRSLADPGPLGVLAFAVGSFVLNFVNAGLIGSKADQIVIPIAIVISGLIQVFVAGWEIARANTFTAAVFGSYGGFWIVAGLWIDKFAKPAGGSAGGALALLLGLYALFTVIFAIAALKTDRVLLGVFSLIAISLILLCAGSASGSIDLTRAGGFVGLIFALLAVYHAAADIVASTFGHEVLPLGRVRS
jgi:succinate-acetate transporter protein